MYNILPFSLFLLHYLSAIFICSKCEEHHDILLGCNSRLCSDCGKRYTDQWAKTLSSKMFDVPHRHAVMTLPDRLLLVIYIRPVPSISKSHFDPESNGFVSFAMLAIWVLECARNVSLDDAGSGEMTSYRPSSTNTFMMLSIRPRADAPSEA